MLELDEDAGSSRLVDVLLRESDRGRPVGVLIDLLVKLLGLDELLDRLLAQPQLVDLTGVQLL